jgi:hypothetical protein
MLVWPCCRELKAVWVPFEKKDSMGAFIFGYLDYEVYSLEYVFS